MKHLQIIFFLIFSSNFIFSMSGSWNSNSASILENKKWEVGLFQPFRYGYSETMEYSVHPIGFFVMPNISFKKKEKDWINFKAASSLSLRYPTPLLNMLSRKGIGGLLDPNLDLPPMLGISYSWIMSKSLKHFDITITNGLDFGLVSGTLKKSATIDLPLVFHRLSVFNNGWGYHGGIDIQRPFLKNFSMLINLDLLLLPNLAKVQSNPSFEKMRGFYSLEHKFLLSWSKSKQFRVTTGYKLVHAEFPFGKQTRLLPYLPLIEKWIPIVELQWSGIKKS
jgi:hypothetical protein